MNGYFSAGTWPFNARSGASLCSPWPPCEIPTVSCYVMPNTTISPALHPQSLSLYSWPGPDSFACIALELSICLSAHLDIEGSSLVGKCIMQECHWLKCHPEMRLKVFKYWKQNRQRMMFFFTNFPLSGTVDKCHGFVLKICQTHHN